jgi:hypothetical protein
MKVFLWFDRLPTRSVYAKRNSKLRPQQWKKPFLKELVYAHIFFYLFRELL